MRDGGVKRSRELDQGKGIAFRIVEHQGPDLS